MDEAGHRVVLKTLDQDCLLEGKLHPNVRDRLARVRELALAGVANLRGVEWLHEKAYLVWEYVEGQTFEEFARTCGDAKELRRMCREMILLLQAMHGMGIVHGAAHGRNFIIDHAGKVRLTHVSPLLYDDPVNDAHELIACVKEAVRERGWEDSELAKAVSAAEGVDQPLKHLGQRLAAGKSAALESRDQDDGRLRKSLVAGAVAAGLAGLAATAILWWTLRATPPPPLEPPQAPAKTIDK